MGKEPAGLRRWRLAHKKKRRVRRVVVVKRRRSRRGRKSKGRRGGKSLPAIQSLMIGYPIYQAYKQHGLTVAMLDQGVYNLTGFTPSTGKLGDPQKAVAMGVGLLVVSTLGAKIANRTGANRLIKKFSAGMVKLA